jgi:hypothetical protein
MMTIERINELTRERAELFRQASTQGRKDALARVTAVDAELAQLWELRRRERAGNLDGIDAVVDAAYRRIYGGDYEETVRPSPVQEPSNEPEIIARAA